MKTIKEFQEEIRAKYPDFKTLPFFTKLKIKLNQYPSSCTDTIEEGCEKISQSYKTYEHDGQIYFYKFGW